MGNRRRLVVLGATGSIGRSALEVIRYHSDVFSVVALAALRSEDLCAELAREFAARAYVGADAAMRAVAESDADLCLVATVGASGLMPTLAAIEKGMDVALATKEVLVMAGGLVMAAARRKGVRILPVDSEHSAIFQCLGGRVCDGLPRPEISRLTLTASGGPFLAAPESLSDVTAEQALRHPRWKMGPKVTVDSATMMNKGFETIEARWLFGVPLERIDVVVHPESVVHSLVEFTDGSTLAQLSPPDMRVAIQYALTCPERLPAERSRLDLASLGKLTFQKPDRGRFPCLGLAAAAHEKGGCAPAALAAADEWAVGRFIEGRIRFTDIARAAEDCLEAVPQATCDSPEDVFAAIDWTNRHLESKWKC